MKKSLLTIILALGLMGLCSPAWASDASPASSLIEATQAIHDMDDKGQAFTVSIALLGGSGAIGLGAWLLHERPLATNGSLSPMLFGNGLLLTGTGVGQFVHAFMRLGERKAGAAAARRLLDNPDATDEQHLRFLRMRAQQSTSTRLVGAIITTLQGVSATTAGLEMALTKDSTVQTSGWVIAGLGLAGTGVGAIHFFGKTRARRELDKALAGTSAAETFRLELAPTVLRGKHGSLIAGLSARGTF